jgi:hypothetical protein
LDHSAATRLPPTKYVLTRHDDGAWYRAELLGQYLQPDGRWRCVVRYSVAPGFTYQRGLWADELRREEDGPPDDQPTTVLGPPAVMWISGGLRQP